jgi:hypothetical protein
MEVDGKRGEEVWWEGTGKQTTKVLSRGKRKKIKYLIKHRNVPPNQND